MRAFFRFKTGSDGSTITHYARVFIRYPLRSSDAQTRRHFNSGRRAEPRRWCRGKRGDLQRRLRDACPPAALCRRGSPGHASPDESFARCVLDHCCAGEPARLASSGEIFRGHRGLSMVDCRSDRRRSKRTTARTPHHAGVLQSSGRTVDGRDVQSEAIHGERRKPEIIIGRGLWQRRFGSDASLLGKVLDINIINLSRVGPTPSFVVGIALADVHFPPLSADFNLGVARHRRFRGFLGSRISRSDKA